MSAAASLQVLLRFLSQDAKVPLATAMAKVKSLQDAGLSNTEAIAEVSLDEVKKVFPDDKTAKRVHNAAKRVSKKRKASTDDTPIAPSPVKKRQKSEFELPQAPADLEKSLELPHTDVSEEELKSTVLITNRAPLVLAFAVTVLKYTMPSQPVSSRLSLAQAVVSANSRTKAVSIGLESGKSAEEEGWGAGQPVVKVLGREIRVMKRWGYEWKKEEPEDVVKEEQKGDSEEEQVPKSSERTVGRSQEVQQLVEAAQEQQPALWGIDLEALKKHNGPVVSSDASATGGLPIFTPQSARDYLLKSFESPTIKEEGQKTKKKTNAEIVAERERNLGMLLQALDLLYQSWEEKLGRLELDRRAWSWYCRVRPDVQAGVAGWGGKGEVKLADLLTLRKGG